MRKALIAPLLAAALLVPALATGASNNLAGTVDPSGTVSMTVKKKNGHKKVVKFAISQVPMTCDSGNETTSANTTGVVMKVDDNNKFAAKLSNGQQPPAILNIAGKVLDGGKAAKGTVRVTGRVGLDPFNGSNYGTHCDTGKRPWTAAKL